MKVFSVIGVKWACNMQIYIFFQKNMLWFITDIFSFSEQSWKETWTSRFDIQGITGVAVGCRVCIWKKAVNSKNYYLLIHP